MKKTIIYSVAIIVLLVLFTGCSWSNSSIDVNAESSEPSNQPEDLQTDSSTTNTQPPNVSEPPPIQAERLGFEGGNIGAGGLVCGADDGFIYYRSESDGWRLYRASPDGLEKTKISDRIPSNINVLDGWVIFLDYGDGFSIYSVRTDGTDEKKLVEGYCSNLYVAESGMYFNKSGDDNKSHIYRADLDGGNITLLFPEASLMYYYDGKIYLGAAPLGVFDIESGEEKILVDTYVHNVSVDDSGIYYWAVDEGEFRSINLDGSNDRLILRGGDFFNYSDGNLYYMGIDENDNGPCHVINMMKIATGETTRLIEEANEFFDAQGEWVGVTYQQFFQYPESIDPELMIPNAQGEIEIGWSESVGYVYISGEYLFMRTSLRESIIQNGRLDCIARLDSGVMVWD